MTSYPVVVLAVDVFEVEVDQAGVCCSSCPSSPAYAGCCPVPVPPPPRSKKSSLCTSRAVAAKRVQSAIARTGRSGLFKGNGKRRRLKRSRRMLGGACGPVGDSIFSRWQTSAPNAVWVAAASVYCHSLPGDAAVLEVVMVWGWGQIATGG